MKPNLLISSLMNPIFGVICKKTLTQGHKTFHLCSFKNIHNFWGTWVAQSVKDPTLVQVMISRFMGSNSVLGSLLTAQSLDPTLDSVSPLLSDSLSLSLSLFLSKINKYLKTFLKN